MRRLRTMLLAVMGAVALVSPAFAQEGWHTLAVPGGRATLRALGVDDSRERAAVMIELIRRLHFATSAPVELEAAIRAIPAAPFSTPGSALSTSVTLPLPMAPAAWERIVGRALPPDAMFRAILSDVPARLLFHGLAGLDRDTREWFERDGDLLRAVYRDHDAVKAFALFAPGVQVAGGRVVIPGGGLAEARWSKAVGVPPTEPRRFLARLFLERAGRVAGLYFLAASVEAPRRQFVLHAHEASGDERFSRLVNAFAGCYPSESNDYPFVLRSNDPGLLLLNVKVSASGQPEGPRAADFWERVFSANDLSPGPVPRGGKEIDAAWLVERLCSSATRDRAGVFSTLLAGQRLFTDLPPADTADAVVALRVRRLFPAVFIAMERAGVRNAGTFAAIGRHALRLDRLNDLEHTVPVLQQFQGALAMVLRSATSGTISQSDLARLLDHLADVTINGGRYDGRLASWITRQFLPAIGSSAGTAEEALGRALAGPPAAPTVRVSWEGLDYVVDYAATARDRLKAVREKQGGPTLDQALELSRTARTAAEVRMADAMLGQVLASWTYAPHIGGADSGALIGGDGSRRHDLGLRAVNRTRFEQRWTLAIAPGDRGVIAGSHLGLEAGLASWSLRRLSADVIPPEPTLGDNDRMSLMATVSLSQPSRMSDPDMHRIAAAIEAGQKQIAAAGNDAARLESLARSAGMSPWRRAALGWMVSEEPTRIPEQFSLSMFANAGGLAPAQIPAWGTSAIPTGCLCLAAPIEGVPELIVGRPVDGIVGTRSADLPLRVAQLLTQLKMPAQLMPAVLAYAMRDYIDRLRPMHPADTDAFARATSFLTRTMVEDYLGAVAAVGPLRPVQ
jgi:hypothetical protein